MDDIRATAFCLTVWHAFLATLISTLIILLNDLAPGTAFLVWANIALLFSLWLVARAVRLDDKRLARGAFWRTIPVRLRPAGDAGLRMARAILQETWLRFAKGAAAAAIILCALAYANHDPDSLALAGAAFAPSTAQAMTQP
jgi:hypothetical protein